MTLSTGCILFYVLCQSGVRGRLTEGEVARDERGGLMVYDRYGALNEYVSGEHLKLDCHPRWSSNFGVEPCHAGRRRASNGLIGVQTM